jgi:hypothetical protein
MDYPMHKGFRFARNSCPRCVIASKLGLDDQCHTVFNSTHDAAYCTKHNIWVEPLCEDPSCKFCATRPTKPLDKKE